MNGRIFVFDWINLSQLKHLLDPECIVMVSVDSVMTRSCLIQDRSPAPECVSVCVASWRWLFRCPGLVTSPVWPHPRAPGQCQGHRALSNDQCQHPQCQTQCQMLSNTFWVMDGPWESKYVTSTRCKTITNKEVFDVKWLRPVFVWTRPW